jgi:hypothetical protein
MVETCDTAGILNSAKPGGIHRRDRGDEAHRRRA